MSHHKMSLTVTFQTTILAQQQIERFNNSQSDTTIYQVPLCPFQLTLILLGTE